MASDCCRNARVRFGKLCVDWSRSRMGRSGFRIPDQSNEQRYFDALKQITKYMSVDKIRRSAEKEYGLMAGEALEMAYENVISEAERAVRGKRRPKV